MAVAGYEHCARVVPNCTPAPCPWTPQLEFFAEEEPITIVPNCSVPGKYIEGLMVRAASTSQRWWCPVLYSALACLLHMVWRRRRWLMLTCCSLPTSGALWSI